MVRRDWLALDLRALAFFRIFLAAFAALDLLTALTGLRAFYSDQGVLPRSDVQLTLTSGPFAVFFGSGEAWCQVPWIMLGLVCVGLVAWGRHTRLALFWLWYLLVCLHVRDPHCADRGAVLLEVMIFWGFFLPLEARYSWKSARNPHWLHLPNRYRSCATIALLAQFCLIFLFTTLLKHGPEWTSGRAVLCACRSGQVSTPYSEWLALFPRQLYWVSWFILAFEACVPLLILTPIAHNQARTMVALSLMAFHLNNNFVFRLGYFPLMNAFFSVILLPTWFWDRCLGNAAPGSASNEGSRPVGYRLTTFERFWLGLCLLYALYCNIRTYPLPRHARLAEPMRSFGKLFRLEQNWSLFSPSPPNDLWFRLRIRDTDGQERDLWRSDQKVSLEREPVPMALVPGHGWQMVLLNSIYEDNPALSRNIWTYWHAYYQSRGEVLAYEAVFQRYDHDNRARPPLLRCLWPAERVPQKHASPLP